MLTIQTKILAILKKTRGNVVLNTSFSESCTGVGGKCQEEEIARKKASVWATNVRDLGLEQRILHITTAGNITANLPNVFDARTRPPFAAARLLENLTQVDKGISSAVPNLSNTLVVESVVHETANENTKRIVPVCQESHSFDGGDISAIGKDVLTSRDPWGVEKSWAYGTSFAAPQVAGLATYLWSVKQSNKSLSPAGMIHLLQATAFNTPGSGPLPECSLRKPAPTIDAYDALLSVDATTDNPSMEAWPVRFGLMDVNNDKIFDEADLIIFYKKFFASSAVPLQPVRDFGRYDLNGDGWTTVKPLVQGNIETTMPFDLLRVGSSQFGRANLTKEVSKVINNEIVTFNETEVTDLDILCY